MTAPRQRRFVAMATALGVVLLAPFSRALAVSSRFEDDVANVRSSTKATSRSLALDDCGLPSRESLDFGDRSDGVYSFSDFDDRGRVVGAGEFIGWPREPIRRQKLVYGPDGLPRVSRVTDIQPAESVSLFQFDVLGRVTAEGTPTATVPILTPSGATNAGVASYLYQDPAWRTYQFDAADNWAQRSSADSSLATSPSVSATNSYLSFGSDSPQYDLSGNLTRIAGQELRYDGQGNLAIASPGAKELHYVYDAFGRLAAEVDANGSARGLIPDGDRIVGELDLGNGATKAKVTVYGAGLDEPFARIDGNEEYFYHLDPFGSVAMLTDAKGAAAETMSYTAFGEPTFYSGGTKTATSALGNRFGFQGQYYSPDLGMYLMRSRWYVPGWGRFASPDRAGFAFGANLYAFAGNAPLLFADPFGFGPKPVNPFGPNGPPWQACRMSPAQCADSLDVPLILGKELLTTLGSVVDLQHKADVAAAMTAVDLARGGVNMLRLGVGSAAGVEAARSGEGWLAAARISEDVVRAAGLFNLLAAGFGALANAILPGSVGWRATSDAAQGAGDAPAVEAQPPDALGGATSGGAEAAEGGVQFAQRGVSATFRHGEFAGKTIEEVAAGLRGGAISPSQLPIQTITRNGVSYTLNNRSLMALRQAGLEPTVVQDVTGNAFFEAQLTQRLGELGGSVPADFVPVIRGGGP